MFSQNRLRMIAYEMRPVARKNVHFEIWAPGRATVHTYLSSSGKGETSVLPCWPAYSGRVLTSVALMRSEVTCAVSG